MTADVYVSRHPLVLHRLSLLRDRTTPPPLFRQLVRELSLMLFVEAAQDLELAPVTVQTPLAECAGPMVQVLDPGGGLLIRSGLLRSARAIDVSPRLSAFTSRSIRSIDAMYP